MQNNKVDDNRPILLIEDDEVDVMTVKRAWKQLKISNPLHHGENGEEALEYLNGNKDQLPCLIIMDINMPRMNGIEFLKVIKKEEIFKRIPVIVLTTSKEEQDRYETFNLSVAGYIVKPLNYDQFVNVMKIIQNYWSINEFSN